MLKDRRDPPCGVAIRTRLEIAELIVNPVSPSTSMLSASAVTAPEVCVSASQGTQGTGGLPVCDADSSGEALGVPSVAALASKLVQKQNVGGATDTGVVTHPIFTFLPPGRERYTVESEIGRGGMGRVWAVREVDVGRIVAMKVLEDGLDADAADLGRFISEAQITGQLEHPNIVPVHEMGLTQHGQPYFTMKRVRGMSLAEILFRLKHHDEKIVRQYDRTALLRILLKVCDAVAYAHDRGVIHRDLKPDNVMVGRFGDVLLMDWGLAKVLPNHRNAPQVAKPVPLPKAEADSERFPGPARVELLTTQSFTLKGMIAGTPPYMAPEQARGNLAHDPASYLSPAVDIYALGAMLYEICVYEAPYVGDNAIVILRQLLDGPPKPLEQHPAGRGLPRELCAIAAKAMQQDPKQRYPSAEAFAQDIERFLDRRPVSVYRDSLWGRAAKWAVRQPAIAVTVVAVMVLLAVATGLSWVALDQAHKRRLETERALEIEKRRSEVVAQLYAAEKSAREEREKAYRRGQIDVLRQNLPGDLLTVDPSRFEELYGVCNRILALDPQHMPTRIDRAIVLFRLSRLDAATDDLRLALSTLPHDERANFVMARVLEQRGDLPTALTHLSAAIERNPLDFSRHVLRLHWLARLERFRDLQGEISRLMERTPLNAALLCKLRVRYFDWEYSRMPQTQPRNSRPLTHAEIEQAVALLLDTRYAAALVEFTTLSEQQPTSIIAWYGKACCCARLNLAAEALDALSQAWVNGLRDMPDPVLWLDPDLDLLHDNPAFRAIANSATPTRNN